MVGATLQDKRGALREPQQRTSSGLTAAAGVLRKVREAQRRGHSGAWATLACSRGWLGALDRQGSGRQDCQWQAAWFLSSMCIEICFAAMTLISYHDSN